MMTFPLAFAAITTGLVGGLHCVGMCGGISTLLSQAPNRIGANVSSKVIAIQRIPVLIDADAVVAINYRHQILLHSGRLFTYMLIGAVFGGVGAAGMQLKLYFPVHKILFVIGNLALVLLGMQLLGLTIAATLLKKISAPILRYSHAFMPAIEYGKRHPFLMGMSWGCLPCGLLYGVAPFAFLSGEAVSGAVLMLLFGLSALPHLLFTQTLFNQTNSGRFAAQIRAASAVVHDSRIAARAGLRWRAVHLFLRHDAACF